MKIKFRGKCKEDGEWMYGYLTADVEMGKYYIGNYGFGNLWVNEVTPETVGQFTGMHDKNSVEIYKDDVVEAYDLKDKQCFRGVVEFDNASFFIKDNNGCISHYRWMDYTIHKIGNIHENPELLVV